MNKIIFVFTFLFCITAAHAQTERRLYTSSELKEMQANTEKSQEKEQKKHIESLKDSIYYAKAVQSLETLNFVMEADMLMFKRGKTFHVLSSKNFISLSDDKAVVQVAPFNGGGHNGIGGITLEGRASNIKIKTDKKGNMTFSMSVMGAGLSATIDIQLPKGSNKVSATISPNFHSNRITLSGRLVPADWSDIHKGMSL